MNKDSPGNGEDSPRSGEEYIELGGNKFKVSKILRIDLPGNGKDSPSSGEEYIESGGQGIGQISKILSEILKL